MEQTKDYSLLRPFDLEAAKAGETFICTHDGSSRKYIAGPDTEDKIIVADSKGVFQKSEYYREHYRMAPLAWVEGKPVYKGDVLYHLGMGQKVTAKAPADGLHIVSDFELDGCVETAISALTWNLLTVKREGWVNIYGHGSACYRYHTKEDADNSARLGSGIIDPARIACVRIEWEE